jgi:hypothetical protein
VNEQVKKMHINPMNIVWQCKKNEILTFVTTWIELGDTMLSEIDFVEAECRIVVIRG